MAIMIPENVQMFTTDGERTFYKFLENVAKPASKYTAWYSPDLDNKEPDFVLYNRDCGIVIFEVKDWALEQIIEADPKTFKLRIKGKVETRANPIQQAVGYMHDLMDILKSDGRLISNNPAHLGKPIIPISYGVVFTNINKHEYMLNGFHQIIATNKAFFWDDLHPQSEICQDPSGNCFDRIFNKMFPPLFPFKLSGMEMDHLKQLIFPSVRVEIPERSPNPYPVRSSRLKSLDNHQEAIARKFENGHRILSGPSGCGKTLVLVHKAEYLLKYNPNIKTILFVCFNVTLVNYIKRLLSNKGLPLGENGIHVIHYYQLCADILGEDVAFEKENTDYYELISQTALEKLETSKISYDAILVDEGQDFSADMLKVLTGVLNPKTNNLTLALDENQNLYRREFSWSDIGIQVRGRVHKISNVYRSTKQLSRFAYKFIGQNSTKKSNAGYEQKELFPDFFNFAGPLPEIVQLENFESICQYIVKKTAETVEQDKCPFSEVAVLYVKKNLSKDTLTTAPELIEQAFAEKGIFSNWIARDFQNKLSYDITTNSAAINTIHSSKGFDYASVFLVGLDSVDQTKTTVEQIERLAYVGITRARYQLCIPYIEKTPIIEKLLEAN
jgi:DNA polymerase III delta prime subunit